MKKKIEIALSLILIGALLTAYIIDKYVWKKYFHLSKDVTKYKKLSRLEAYWIIQKQRGNKCCEYLKQRGVYSVAVYYSEDLMEAIINELNAADIKIECFIVEEGIDIYFQRMKVVSFGKKLQDVDAIVVADMIVSDEKKELLCKTYDLPVLSLEDILFRNVMQWKGKSL